MEVNINGNTVTYKSDFDPININDNVKRGWKVSAGDYFKYPVKIDTPAPVDCFIKRFSKASREISGYDFVFKIKGEKLKGLPKVFDLVHTMESDKPVIYLFLEYIHGNTLDNLQRDGFTFLPCKLGEDLFFALKSIHDNGSWFPDFDPKNFLRSEKGDFYIIDLDSTYPLSASPAGSMFGSKDFWAPSHDFYRTNGNFTSEQIKKMKGDVLNHLNLIYLMGLYSFYLDEQGKDLTAYSIVHLNKFLSAKHRLFATTMIYCFNKEKGSDKVNQRVPSIAVFRNFLKTVLFPEDFERTFSDAPKKPEILFFTANGKDTHNIEINAGSDLVLQWEAKDTTSMRLLPDNRLVTTKGTLSIVPFDDVTYSLQVVHKYKNRSEEVKKSIDINIHDPNVKRPVIDFIIDGYLQKALLLEDMDYTIQWKVTNAQKVFLDEAKVTLKGTRDYVATKNCSHTIKTINEKNGKIKKAEAIVEIEVEKRPEINLSVSPSVIKSGQSVTLYWNSTHGKDISIIQDGITIAYNQRAEGSLNLVLKSDKSTSSPQSIHFTASVYSNSGNWISETPGKQTVIVKKKRDTLWIILGLIAAVIFIIWLYWLSRHT